MSRIRARKLRRTRKVLAFALSLMMFVGVLSYAGVALAAELNRITFNMRVTGFTLNDGDTVADVPGEQVILVSDAGAGSAPSAPANTTVYEGADKVTPPTTGTELPEVSEEVRSADPADGGSQVKNPAPETVVEDEAADETYKADGITQGTASKDELAAKVTDADGDLTEAGDKLKDLGLDLSDADLEIEKNADGVKAILTEAGITPAENTDYVITSTDVEISADKKGAVLKSELEITTKDGKETLKAGTIEVTLSAEAAGNAKVFSEGLGTVEVNMVQKDVVLAVDVTSSMAFEDIDGQARWKALCSAIESFVGTVYGSTKDKDGNWSKPTNENVAMNLVVYGGNWENGENGIDPRDAKTTGGEMLQDSALLASMNFDFGKLDTAEKVADFMGYFTGNYETDKNKYSYENYLNKYKDSIAGIYGVDKNPTAPVDASLGLYSGGTNNEAGYSEVLRTVERIIAANETKYNRTASGVDPGYTYDPSNITVIYLTDGGANQSIYDEVGKAGQVDADYIERNADLFAGKTQQEKDLAMIKYHGRQAADEAIKVLKKGVDMYNIVLLGDNDVSLKNVRDYMDPDYSETIVTGRTFTESNTGSKVRIGDEEYSVVNGKVTIDRKEYTVNADGSITRVEQVQDGVTWSKVGDEVKCNNGHPIGDYFRSEKVRLTSDEKRKLNELTKDDPPLEIVRGGVKYCVVKRVDNGNKNPVTYAQKMESEPKFKEEIRTLTGATIGDWEAVTEELGYLKSEVAKLDETAGKITYSRNSLGAGATTDLTTEFDKIAKTLINVAAQNLAIAYDAKIIDRVPADFTVVLAKDSKVKIICTDPDTKETILEWDIGALEEGKDYAATYFMLPNNSLGDLQFGTTMLGSSAVMYAKPVTAGGKEIAIVLDQPIVTLAAKAGNDPIENKANTVDGAFPYMQSTATGDAKINYSLLQNDSGANTLDKLQASGTSVSDTTIANIKDGISLKLLTTTGTGVDAKTEETPLTAGTVNTEGTGADSYFAFPLTGKDGEGNDLDYGKVKINKATGVVTFEEGASKLFVNQLIDIGFGYTLSFTAGKNTEKEATQRMISTSALATLKLQGAEPLPVPDPPVVPPVDPPVVPPVDPPVVPPVDPPVVPPVNPPVEPPIEQPDEPEVIQQEDVPLEGPADRAIETIPVEATPLAGARTPAWALLNLILTIATCLASAAMLIGYAGKKQRKDEADVAVRDIKKHGIVRLCSIIPGIGAVIAFLLTENMRLPMVFTDEWTLLMAVISLIQLAVVFFGVKREKDIVPEEAK